MKTLSALILTAILAGCAGSQESAVQSDTDIAQEVISQPAIIQLEPIVTPVSPIVTVTPPAVASCDLTTYNPCGKGVVPPSTLPPVCDPKAPDCIVPEGMELCDLWSYNPCAHPTWVPKTPIIVVCPQSTNCSPSPAPLPSTRVSVVASSQPSPSCIRNNLPLVIVDGVFTDNCGAKYGEIK